MTDDKIKIEICITDFIENAIDESAFSINFQVNGPGARADFLRVSFSEVFLEEYFRIKFPKDLIEEGPKILKSHRDLFIKWGVCKIEQWINRGREEENLMVDSGEDLIWAKKVELGNITQKSTPTDERNFLYIKHF